MKLDTLKARIGRAEYEVDTEAVADAIVRRLLGVRAESTSSNGPRPSLPGTPLEAA